MQNKRTATMILLLTFLLVVPLYVSASTTSFQESGTFFADDEAFYLTDDVYPGILRVDKETKESQLLYRQDITNMYDGIDVVYFTVSSRIGIYSINKDGTNLKQVISDRVQDFVYHDGYIYYISATDFKLHKADSTGKDLLKSKLEFYYITDYDHNLYIKDQTLYAVSPPKSIYTLDINTLTSEKIFTDDYLYVDNIQLINKDLIIEGDSILYVYNLDNKEITRLSDSVDSYHIIDNTIYFDEFWTEKTMMYDLSTKVQTTIPTLVSSFDIGTYGSYARRSNIIYKVDNHTFTPYINLNEVIDMDSSAYDKILDEAIKKSNAQKYIQRQNTVTTYFDGLKHESVLKESYDNGSKVGVYTVDEKVTYKNRSYTSYTESWIYKDAIINNYGTSKKPAYTYYDDITKDSWAELLDSQVIDYVSYFNVEETDSEIIYEISLRNLKDMINDKPDIVPYIPSEGVYDYLGKLYIDKKTKLITKLTGDLTIRKDFDEDISREYDRFNFEVDWSYRSTSYAKAPSGLSTYYQNRLVMLPDSREYTEEETFIEDYLDYSERKKLYDMGYILYFYYYNGEEENEELYNLLKAYVDSAPGDLDALYHLLKYEVTHKNKLNSFDLKPLKENWDYRSSAYLLEYTNTKTVEEAQVVLDQWLVDYPNHAYPVESKLEQYFYYNDFEGALKFGEERFELSGFSKYYLALAAYYESDLQLAEKYLDLSWYENNEYTDYLYTCIEIYYRSMNLDKVKKAVDALLELDPEDSIALDYEKKFQGFDFSKDGAALVYIMRENYLSYKSNSQITAMESSLMTKETLTPKEIKDYYDLVILPDDHFSGIYGIESAKMPESTVTTKSNKDSLYVHLDIFGEDASKKVIEAFDTVEKPESTDLILDFRSNGGGSAFEANAILDALLPEVIPYTTIYQDGSTNTNYSDDSHYPFKHIYILVDKDSASASEMVTLSLSEYYDHVTIVGETTFGKGIGQTTFTNHKYGYDLWLVNFWWNVRQKNINEVGIKPDIQVTSSSLEDYLKTISKEFK